MLVFIKFILNTDWGYISFSFSFYQFFLYLIYFTFSFFIKVFSMLHNGRLAVTPSGMGWWVHALLTLVLSLLWQKSSIITRSLMQDTFCYNLIKASLWCHFLTIWLESNYSWQNNPVFSPPSLLSPLYYSISLAVRKSKEKVVINCVDIFCWIDFNSSWVELRIGLLLLEQQH